MDRIYSFATGNIWRWSKKYNKLLTYIKKLDIDGIELTFGHKENLFENNISKSNYNWLKKMDNVSIHAPFGLIRRADSNEEVIKQLDFVSEVYNKVEANNLIIHPYDIPSKKILKKYNFKVSTENLPKKSQMTIPKLEKILDKYENMGLCLDVAHAYLWSKDECKKIVDRLGDKITQIHLSGTYKRRDHQSLTKVTKTFLKSIEPIKELDVPFVIEEDIFPSDVKYLQDEIKYIRKVLK